MFIRYSMIMGVGVQGRDALRKVHPFDSICFKSCSYYSPRDFLISSTLAFAFSTSALYWEAQHMVSLISQ